MDVVGQVVFIRAIEPPAPFEFENFDFEAFSSYRLAFFVYGDDGNKIILVREEGSMVSLAFRQLQPYIATVWSVVKSGSVYTEAASFFKNTNVELCFYFTWRVGF